MFFENYRKNLVSFPNFGYTALSRRPGQAADGRNSPNLTGRGRKLSIFVATKYEVLSTVSWLHSLCSLDVLTPFSWAVAGRIVIKQDAGYEICPVQGLKKLL